MLPSFTLASLLQGHTRRLRRIARLTQRHAPAAASQTDAELKIEFAAVGAPNRHSLHRSLALAQEAAFRALGLRPYDEQLMGAAALFDGVIAEMKTGEGKTLVIAMAAAMAALEGKGVHVAVPNAYLAMRDAHSMEPLFQMLGLTVGVTVPDQSRANKQAAYASDITYAVHSELGFDYLRDHLVARSEQRVQRGLHFAIVDEADSILIDEARTPLVISQPSQSDSVLVRMADEAVRPLIVGRDVTVEEPLQDATFTERGMGRIGAWLASHRLVASAKDMYEGSNLYLMRYLTAALRARFVYRRDRDYLVRDAQVHIIDRLTGRVLNGRRWQRGLHQAVEAKERLTIQPEADTTAEITFQNFFGLYSQVAGLTGTALSAHEEFETIYERPVIAIPTHRPVIRADYPDLLFADRATKFLAVVDDVVTQHESGRPVLIGTGSVEESEAVSAWLTWAKVPHRVLNARQNGEEAQIIADAGLPGAVTVATTMAGRGTDILLGGRATEDPEWALGRDRMVAAGGLHVIGTLRHDSRRLDDQLRGRSGRQGDPGSSRFYLALEDDLLRVCGEESFSALAALVDRTEGQGLSSPFIVKAVASVQQKVEAARIGLRHQMSRTDDAISQQRAVVYALRDEVLENKVGFEYLETLLNGAVSRVVDAYVSPQVSEEQWELLTLKSTLKEGYGVNLPLLRWASLEHLDAREIRARVVAAVVEFFRSKRSISEQGLTELEQLAVLTALDRTWREQLMVLDSIREGIHLRVFAHQNPVYAFAKEARDAFLSFQQAFEDMSVGYLWKVLRSGSAASRRQPAVPAAPLRPRPDGARLAACPCGSSVRFKHCHGRLDV